MISVLKYFLRSLFHASVASALMAAPLYGVYAAASAYMRMDDIKIYTPGYLVFFCALLFFYLGWQAQLLLRALVDYDTQKIAEEINYRLR